MLANALERLRAAGAGPTSGNRGLREVVQSLEEELLRERAKSQRSASKRGQEQRHLMEQVGPCNLVFTQPWILICNSKCDGVKFSVDLQLYSLC